MIADIIIFGYDFYFTDVLGILIIFFALLFPIAVKGYYEGNKVSKKE